MAHIPNEKEEEGDANGDVFKCPTGGPAKRRKISTKEDEEDLALLREGKIDVAEFVSSVSSNDPSRLMSLLLAEKFELEEEKLVGESHYFDAKDEDGSDLSNVTQQEEKREKLKTIEEISTKKELVEHVHDEDDDLEDLLEEQEEEGKTHQQKKAQKQTFKF